MQILHLVFLLVFFDTAQIFEQELLVINSNTDNLNTNEKRPQGYSRLYSGGAKADAFQMELNSLLLAEAVEKLFIVSLLKL